MTPEAQEIAEKIDSVLEDVIEYYEKIGEEPNSIFVQLLEEALDFAKELD